MLLPLSLLVVLELERIRRVAFGGGGNAASGLMSNNSRGVLNRDGSGGSCADIFIR